MGVGKGGTEHVSFRTSALLVSHSENYATYHMTMGSRALVLDTSIKHRQFPRVDQARQPRRLQDDH